MIYNLSVHVSPGGRPPAPPGWGWMCTGVWWTAPAPPSSSPWAGHCSRVRYDNTISGVITLLTCQQVSPKCSLLETAFLCLATVSTVSNDNTHNVVTIMI